MMTRLLLVFATLAVLSPSAFGDDFYEGYVCEVRLVPLETYNVVAPDPAGIGRMNFSVRPNADCTGTFSVLWVCSVDAPAGGDCPTGKKFTRTEMQSMYGALTNAIGTGLRAAAYTATGRTAISILHIKR